MDPKHSVTKTVSLTDAAAQLERLVDLAAAGEVVVITRSGSPVARLEPIGPARRAISLEELRRVTNAMPMQAEGAGDFLRSMRNAARW